MKILWSSVSPFRRSARAWGETAGGGEGRWLGYVLAVLGVGLVFFLRAHVLAPILGVDAPLTLFLAPVAAAAWYGGFSVGLFATFLGFAVGGYFLLPPYESVEWEPEYGVRLLAFLGIGIFISWISESLFVQRRKVSESERALATLVRNLPGMHYRRRNDSRWSALFVSEGVERITGFAPGSFTSAGVDWLERIHPDDRAWVRQRVSEALEREATFQLEYRILDAEGRERWVWEQGVGLRDSSGEVAAIEGFITEVTARKEFEIELQKFKFLTDHAPEAFFLLDETGSILYANQMACRRLGYTSEELSALRISELDLLLTEPKLVPFLDGIASPSLPPFESIHRRKDRSTFPVEVSLAAIALSGRHYFFATARDITERKKGEEQLRLQEERLRLAFRVGRLGALHLDLETSEIVASDQCKADFGFPPQKEVSIRDLTGAIHPRDRLRVERAALRAITRRTDWEAEFRTLWPDGSGHWILARARPQVRDDGTPKALVAITLDVTERKRSEEAHREGERRFRDLADAIPQIVWTTDRRGVATYFNRRWYEFGGPALGEEAPAGWTELVHPEERAATLNEFRASLESEAAFEKQNRFQDRRTGGYRWHLVRVIPVPDRHGKVETWFGTATDIHAQKMAEEDLKLADQRKDEFLATLAHEIRNPLAVIANALGVLSLKDDEETRRELREMMVRQSKQLTRLMDDLMDVSRVTRGKIVLRKTRVELSTVVQSALEAARLLAQSKGQEIVVEQAQDRLLLEADAERLVQVVMNLLHNATKFTPRGGRISLRTARDGDRAVLRIGDNGIGIPPDRLSSIFEMFSQANRGYESSYGGLGVGLTLARSLVEIHGGVIEVRSEGPGRGSEFEIRLPLAQGPTEPIERGAETAAPMDSRLAPGAAPARFRILVVDDSMAFASVFSELLRELGHQVEVATNGADGLAICSSLRPEILFSDVSMPGMSGYRFAKLVLERLGSSRPVLVAVTGYGQERDRTEAFDAGFDFHLVKPPSLARLQELFAEIAARRRLQVTS